MPPRSFATPGVGHKVGTEAEAPLAPALRPSVRWCPAPPARAARIRSRVTQAPFCLLSVRWGHRHPAPRPACSNNGKEAAPGRSGPGRQEESKLPVQGLLPLGVLDPQGAQNRIDQRLVLEDDSSEAMQERHRGDPGSGRAATPSVETRTPTGAMSGRGPGRACSGSSSSPAAPAAEPTAEPTAPRRKSLSQ